MSLLRNKKRNILTDNSKKTTTKEGKRDYMRTYMQITRAEKYKQVYGSSILGGRAKKAKPLKRRG